MKIQLNSVLVEDQEKALRFYTDVLGFVKQQDIPMGEFRWLTVISPKGHDDVELVLEPSAIAAAKTYQRALFEQGSRRRRSRSTTSPPSTRGWRRKASTSASRRRRPAR